MNAPHFHLILNHFPVGGVLLGLLLLLISIWRPNLSMARIGMGIIMLAGVIAIPTYLSGGAAEDVVEKLPGISKRLIEIHEEAAEKTIWFVEIAALSALVGWILSVKRNEISRKLLIGISLAAAIASGFLAWTNQLGGEIGHPEIRQPSNVNALVPLDEGSSHNQNTRGKDDD